MSRPTRAEQRRARKALLTQGLTVLLALMVATVKARSRPCHHRDSGR
ncbi:hypothetical protein SAXI111661_21360 [Saccharomonospora xinjiangensis]|nr:hypothetical protein [Saccharomonospora xinjiangensis]QBQ61162.1 hypothetical protein EYD13_14050 [Saccharomonospora xinjiangensis]